MKHLWRKKNFFLINFFKIKKNWLFFSVHSLSLCWLYCIYCEYHVFPVFFYKFFIILFLLFLSHLSLLFQKIVLRSLLLFNFTFYRIIYFSSPPYLLRRRRSKLKEGKKLYQLCSCMCVCICKLLSFFTRNSFWLFLILILVRL